MIEVDTPGRECVVTIRFCGVVTNREFIDLAAGIADFRMMGGALVYLDWSRIDRWTHATSEANGTIAWRNAARAIERAAIVHQPRLNRQAAWLAAVLRAQGVTVRSWRLRDAAKAATWLRMATPPGFPQS